MVERRIGNTKVRLFLKFPHRPAHGLADEHVGLGVAVVVEALVAGSTSIY